MTFEFRFDLFAVFMLLGVFQGVFLAYFFLNKKNKKHQVNVFWGLLLLNLVIINSELLLNYSGLIVKIIWLENYSEAFIFLIPPLAYMIFRIGFGSSFSKDDWIHFYPFIFYLVYCSFYFIQPSDFKYNSYVYCYKPGWDTIDFNQTIPDDPLSLRSSLVQLYMSQFIIYGVIIYQLIRKHKPKIEDSSQQERLNYRRNIQHWIHYIVIFVLIIIIKAVFERDLGDYVIGSYMSILIYVGSFIVLKNVTLFGGESKEIEITPPDKPKYQKSSLGDEKKEDILQKINDLLKNQKVFLKRSFSLSDLALELKEPTHHISQVINEKLGRSFFDVLSEYRIKEAQKLLSNPQNKNLTIEEIAEQVGYNSKAAFNKAFKKITDNTPSDYRKRN